MLQSLNVRFRLLLFCILVLFAGSTLAGIFSAAAQEKKEYNIGVDGTYPPFSHKTIDDRYVGFDIDIAHAICKTLSIKCNLASFKWSNLLAAVRGKKVDFVIATIAITDARRELVDFSDPYIQIPSAIIVRNNSIFSGIEVEDLRDAQFGVLKSSPHGEYIRAHRPETHIKLYDSQAEYYVDLTNRQLDGIVGNPILLDAWLQTADGKACCRMLGTLPHDNQINGEGFAIAVEKKSKELLKQINKALNTITQSGQIDKIQRTHLPFLK
ncbi:MAG: transporter substrate-binding domain-containing protein [Hyphomicrobiales bacterium]|nr:transporter substrate-binding domain-containing protein [Hyphomicrobiales bacterium]